MIRKIAHQIARPFVWLFYFLFDDMMPVTVIVIAILCFTGLVFLFSNVGIAPEKRGNAIEQRRYIDAEAGVACWWTAYGISCLPIAETNLRIPE